MNDKHVLPQWAPRIRQREIRRLYETDAMGIYDEDLLNEVGYGLLVRCESFIDACAAVAGSARCPLCSSTVRHGCRSDEVLRCGCGWELGWEEYFGTIQHHQLSGAEPVLEQFRTFVERFPKARSPQEKMLAIDSLIHGFHWYLKGNSPTRPVAVNLIEGRMRDVVAFLDRLSYSDRSTPGTRENREEWIENAKVNREWYPPLLDDEGS